MKTSIRIGTRGSRLALWQAQHIADLLLRQNKLSSEIVVIKTKGDSIIDKPLPKIGGKGLFTAELEEALRNNIIDIAVHSLKDLPTEDLGEFIIGAVVARGPAEDVLVSKENLKFSELPQMAKVGTSSTRRAAQLLKIRPDLTMVDIRGNVESRIRKVHESTSYDATILAHAGLYRLGFDSVIAEIFDQEIMLCAPGQGALAIQCIKESPYLDELKQINDRSTLLATTAERVFLNELQGGCSKPVAAYAQFFNNTLTLRGRVLNLDGSQCISISHSLEANDDIENARKLGKKLAADAIKQGALTLLQHL